ncbi:nitronate monooxygenase family protein [Microbacterium sp. Marseille-Q6965]|uniref:NAD(P)H-dependent flavin oxidoreductase n=1 Tax=Microbacterium sp. Marseille-Q6965 TaxID=2965072 RepID=UPI0021B78CE2|nr:nitronate monooxygenase [Microbacterium sp. Marseille-Q6965]
MPTPLLESRVPIVAAPMAGGPTTVELATAVADAGGFPFLAGGYQAPASLADEIARLRAHGAPFGVNLFVPAPDLPDEGVLAAYAGAIRAEAERYGIALDPTPVADDDAWAEKLSLLVNDPVPVVSLTFGLPSAHDIAALRRAGSRVLASVTTTQEALAAAEAGVDGLVVQGPDAGGHSAAHQPERMPGHVPTTEVVEHVRAAVGLPLIAAGGVDGPEAAHRLLAVGAEAVAIGTLLLRTDEAGTNPVHRAALADPAFTETVLTRAFTGRPARALRNRFIDEYGALAPVAYPAVHHLTRELRQAAVRAGDADVAHLWAGTGFRSAPEGPAGDVVRWLAGAA